jgi:hypothetical protein
MSVPSNGNGDNGLKQNEIWKPLRGCRYTIASSIYPGWFNLLLRFDDLL